jgi:putative ABC transport system substrate-binding protein
MRRRDFITLLGGAAAAWPVAARGQSEPRRIGFLNASSEDDPMARAAVRAFLQGLRESGWIEGRNLRIDYRFPGDDPKRMLADASALVALKPELVVAGGLPPVRALAQVTASVPIVQVLGADPVASGIVASIRNPAGNITGFSAQEPTLSGKWLEVLKEIVPAMSRVMILQAADAQNRALYIPVIRAAADRHKVELAAPEPRSDADIGKVIAEFAARPGGGMIVFPGPFTVSRRPLIIAQAAQHHLPTVYPYPVFVEEGGLLSYGINPTQLFHDSASYVDRILKGAKPSDLPIQLPSRFELNVNLKTARALGLTIPESFLVRADRVIE